MLLGVAGPGGQFPRPVPVPHIIQGVLGIRFTHIHYTCNMQVFQLFLPVFAVFRAFLHCFSYFWPPGPTCRAELGTGTQSQGAGNHNPPWVGARKTTHRAGSQAAHSTAQGRGTAYRPHPRGGAPPSARGGGTRRAGGETGARGQQTGDRAAQRRGRPADEAGPRRGGTPCPRKRAALCADRPPTADAPRGCAARGKRVGVVAPPRARNQPGQTLQRRPATGGARPHPAPRCRFARAQQTTHWPPGPRWQMAGRRWG